MKIYMHEYALDTNLVLSNDGRVVGVYLDSDDLQNNLDTFSFSDQDIAELKKTSEEEALPLDFDDAA